MGPARGRDFTPSPPARPSAASGEAGNAAPGPSGAGRGGARLRAAAAPAQPRAPARPPRPGARAGPEREEAARGAEKAGAAPRPPPAPSPLTPAPPACPRPGLRTDLTGRDMFAVETGPSRGAKDQDPPPCALGAPLPQLRPRRLLPPSPGALAFDLPPLFRAPLIRRAPAPSLFKMDESNQPKMRQLPDYRNPLAGGPPPALPVIGSSARCASPLVCLNHHASPRPALPAERPHLLREVLFCQDSLRAHGRKTKMVAARPAPLVATPELQIRLGSRSGRLEKKIYEGLSVIN